MPVRPGAGRRRRAEARGGGGGLDEGRGAAARYAGVGPGAGARGALGARAPYSQAFTEKLMAQVKASNAKGSHKGGAPVVADDKMARE